MGAPAIPHLGVLDDRVAARPELPGYSRPEHSFRIYLTLAPLCVKRHGHIPFLQAKTCRSEFVWRERRARPRPLRRDTAAYAVGAQIPMPNGAHIAVRHLRGLIAHQQPSGGRGRGSSRGGRQLPRRWAIYKVREIRGMTLLKTQRLGESLGAQL